MPISSTLLELLRCPKTGQKLILKEGDDGEILVTEDGSITYRVDDDFPIMVDEEESTAD